MSVTIKDLRGKRFGRLLVLSMLNERNKSGGIVWLCLCDCGNMINANGSNLSRGNTNSCGCFRNEQTKKSNSKNKIGIRFGRLTVIEKTNKRAQRTIVWKCVCDCGNEVDVSAGHLQSGHTLSCGCLKIEKASLSLLGERFGLLVVIEKTNQRKHRALVWRCKCDCGNLCDVISTRLIRGDVTSCGCDVVKSNGEYQISKILDEIKVKYFTEHTFNKCRDLKPLKFDFYLPDYNACIEYQGEQHYRANSFWGGKRELKQRQKRDEIKRLFCKKNNMLLIEIPYWEYKNLKNILMENLFSQ